MIKQLGVSNLMTGFAASAPGTDCSLIIVNWKPTYQNAEAASRIFAYHLALTLPSIKQRN